ncbi:helix-turn-helix domain-containing protein [Thermoproteota archaeon]
MKEKLYTVREASIFLGVSERDIIDLSEEGILPAYKVGGIYLRFKKEHLEAIKDKVKVVSGPDAIPYTFGERISDFFYYNDFYILSILVISILVYLIFHL